MSPNYGSSRIKSQKYNALEQQQQLRKRTVIDPKTARPVTVRVDEQGLLPLISFCYLLFLLLPFILFVTS